MSAHADDLRHYYAEELGNTIQLTAPNGSDGVTPELEQGRYAVRIIDFGGATDVWIRQGTSSDAAAAAAPSTRYRGHTTVAELNKPLFYFMVRGGSGAKQFLHAFGVGAAATIQITKVSRGKA